MDRKQLKKHLFRFLKEEGLFSEFLMEFVKQKKIRCSWANDIDSFYCNTVTSIDDYCESIKNGFYLIKYCFLWKETKEGHDFWAEVDRKWSEEYFNKN